MAYLYHAVPRQMKGAVIYPRNQLREVDPELYEEYSRKYADRERLMQERITPLNCLWGDVVFLTAVHPAVFRKAFESTGYVRSRPFRSFEFNASDLDHSQITVLSRMEVNIPTAYKPFSLDKFEEYSTIPQATFDYWREQKAKGAERPFLYLHIPHILYKGTLDTSLARVVEA